MSEFPGKQMWSLHILSFQVKINMEEIKSKVGQLIKSLGYKKVTDDHAIY